MIGSCWLLLVVAEVFCCLPLLFLSTALHVTLSVLVVIFYLATAYDGINRAATFTKHPNKRLDGCTFTTKHGVPDSTICSHLCRSELELCSSFNYKANLKVCELNSCLHTDQQTEFDQEATLENTTESDYYQLTRVTPSLCIQELNSSRRCHPVGSKSCSATVNRVTCNCQEFSTGLTCSQVLQCTSEGKCFNLTSTPVSHDDAVSDCESKNGYLVTADSLDEHLYIGMYLETYFPSTDIHLGIRYFDAYNDFAYTNNKQPVMGYTNWLEVKAASDRLPCVKLSSADGYKWVDVDCSTSLPYICEVPQCPSDFRAFNGSCYYFSSVSSTSSRYPGMRVDQCANRGTDPGWVTHHEEEMYLKTVFNSEFDDGYPVFGGLYQLYSDSTFTWLHNGWIILDLDNKVTYMGCFGDAASNRTMALLEGSYSLVSGDYKLRQNAVQACFYTARQKNYKAFGIQDGGECRGDSNAHLNYDNLGPSSNCTGGEGGWSSNDVYIINNHNLYLDFAFNETDWSNVNEDFVMWWPSFDWRWIDKSQSIFVHGWCKRELCPQGFVSYKNKCYKILDKLLTRDDAQDECQRFRGADLFNPEYSDELTFLASYINNSGITDQQLWTGIIGQYLDGSRLYQAMKKDVELNYNVYPLGPEPIARPFQMSNPDYSLFTVVELRYSFPADGVVVGWEYYVSIVNRPIRFSVLRAQGVLQSQNCYFTVIGVNNFTLSVNGYGRVDVPEEERIRFLKGDYIAVSHTEGGTIPYNHESNEVNFCTSRTNAPSVVGSTLHLSDLMRDIVVSFRVLWIPDGFENEMVFDTSNPDVYGGDGCYISDMGSAMKVMGSACNVTARAVCEIKKRHRKSPDE